MARTITPAFSSFPNEGRIIGNLLAGYTDLEIGLMNCVQVVRNDFDAVLKTMFRVRGETNRINIADALGRSYYAQHKLESEFGSAISVMRHCLRIRNQYAHCAWWDDNSGQLAFANLEEIAKLDIVQTDLKHMTTFHVNVRLLESQEEYFTHADDLLSYVNFEGRFRVGKMTTQPFSVPKRIAQPPLHT